MKFGSMPLAEAIGGILAHAVKADGVVLKKGAVISAQDVERLQTAGVDALVVALLEPGDLPEDSAAERLAEAAKGEHVAAEPAFTGRSNLFSTVAGVLVVDGAKIDAINRLDEAITIATLPNLKSVGVGEMIGTIKIIPFGVAGAWVEKAESLARGCIRVMPYQETHIGVISTLLPGLKPSVIDKTLRVLDDRLSGLNPGGVLITHDVRIAHETEALADVLRIAAATSDDLIIVFGASAIADRRDVIPAAIEAAGGQVIHFGMPVDPGNLLLIGEIAGKPVIGAPGCARSPKENGFDWVLQRMLARIPVTRADIQAMGVGGLLMEIFTRPQPRAPDRPANHPQVAAIILAAGRSSRMGRNKLIEPYQGKPILRHVAEAVLASRAGPVIVVTGHDAEKVSLALAGLDVTFIHNPDYVSGMASSLKAGLAAVPDTSAAALIALGDMPLIRPELIDRLLNALAGEASAKAVVPIGEGRRGNPVILTRALFDAVLRLEGDVGARALLEAAGGDVVEVLLDDAGVLLDVDTPQALQALSAKA